MGDVDWGSAADWVAGVGALVASAVAVALAVRAERTADHAAKEARSAASRERTAALLVELIRAVKRDLAKVQANPGLSADQCRSADAQALCRALWGDRGLFGTTWHFYCEEDRRWIRDLEHRRELLPRMREEMQSALDQLDFEDRAP